MTRASPWTTLGAVAGMASALAACDGGPAASAPDPTDASIDATCGNGLVEPGEDCDDGNAFSGDGCEPDCTWTCTRDSDCDDGDLCNGPERCVASLHRCQAGTPAADLTTCLLPDGDEGACLSGRCGAPCPREHGCDDGDACNGAETCDFDLGFCRPGAAPDCDDGERCTEDRCDPAVGCVHTVLHDEDGDGYASDDVHCDDPDTYGGDCDDTNPHVHPGAEEICGNGIDDDCNGEIDENKTTWYLDCDGDGYAADTHGARAACARPPEDGGCTWTAVRPVDPSTTDCDDATGFAHPGGNATFGFGAPYCVGTGQFATGSYPAWSCPTGSHASWDYDCNGVVEVQLPHTQTGVCQVEGDGCTEASWIASFAPACGQEGELASCGPHGGRCSSDDACLLGCLASGDACCACTCTFRQGCR